MQRLTGLVYERHVSSSNFVLTSLVYAYIRAPRVERSSDMCASARARAAQASSGVRVRALQCSSASARVLECSSAVYRVSHFQTREYNRSHSTLEYKFHVTCTVHVCVYTPSTLIHMSNFQQIRCTCICVCTQYGFGPLADFVVQTIRGFCCTNHQRILLRKPRICTRSLDGQVCSMV